MQIAPQQLASQLQRGLQALYMVAGEEPLLIQESLDAIRTAARALGYDEREVHDVDRGFDWSQLLEAVSSGSLFSSKRIVELRLPGGSPGDEGGKLLRRIAESPPPDVLLLLSAGPLDARQRKSAWYTALESAGAAVYCWGVRPEQFGAWIEQRLRQAGLSADAQTQRLLAERTEGNLLACAQDIEKLKLLCPDRRVSVEALGLAVADSARFDAFDVFDKILVGDAEGSVRGLSRLRDEGVALPEIIGAFAYNLRSWALAAEYYADSGNVQSACNSAKVWRNRQGPMSAALTRVRLGAVRGWFAQLSRIDLGSKSGAAEAAWDELLGWALLASGAAPARLLPRRS